MSDSTKPTTPERVASAPAISIHSTPFNQGSGGHTAYVSYHTQSDYEPFLEEDLKHSHSIALEEFHRCVFGNSGSVELKGALSSIADDSEYVRLIAEFAKAITKENERYEPFVNLINYALGAMREQLGSSFQFPINLHACRSDPFPIRGSAAERKPDTVLIRLEDVDSLTQFWWSQLLFFFEHKHRQAALSTSVDEPKEIPTKGKGTAGAASLSTRTSISGSNTRAPANHTSRSSIQRSTDSQVPRTLASGSNTLAPASNTSRSSVKRSADSQVPSGSFTRSKKSKTGSEQAEPSTEGKEHKKAMLQCASYALELLSHGKMRRYTISSLVVNDEIEFIYYDRSAIFVSEPINFVQDHQSFLFTLLRLELLTIEGWGIETRFQPPVIVAPQPNVTQGTESKKRDAIKNSHLKEQFAGYTLQLNTPTNDVLAISDTLYRQHGLIGRGTGVFRAKLVNKPAGSTSKLDDNQDCIVKATWHAQTRTAESVFFEAANNEVEKNSKDRSILNHLPKLLHSEEIDAGDVQKRFKAFAGDAYELRVLRITVQGELFPITALTNSTDLLEALRGIFKAYRWMYKVVGIMHRDISLNNLMFRRVDDKICGVLNDFDLAVFLNAVIQASKHRTGTKPFLAIDLLEQKDVKHVYRHDLESFFYVMVWHTSRYHDGKEVKRPPLQEWEHGNDHRLYTEKLAFISQGKIKPTGHFKTLTGILQKLLTAFRRGYSERGLLALEQQNQALQQEFPAFNHDTFGDNVTFEKFAEILGVPKT